MDSDKMIDFQKLGETLNECVNEKMFIRVGRYEGDYAIGDGKFKRITGELFIKTNSDTIFRVVDDDSSTIDDFDIIESNAIITPINKELENNSISRNEVNINNKSSLRSYFGKDEIGNEMFECVQSVPPRFREDALDIFINKNDRDMWSLKDVDKAWIYFLEEIIQEMTLEEMKTYGFA